MACVVGGTQIWPPTTLLHTHFDPRLLLEYWQVCDYDGCKLHDKDEGILQIYSQIS